MQEKILEKFSLSKEEYEININKFISGGKLKSWPSKEKPRIAILVYAQELFEKDKEYSEMEINWIIRKFYPDDHVLIRRSLVDYHLLSRTNDGKKYYVESKMYE